MEALKDVSHYFDFNVVNEIENRINNYKVNWNKCFYQIKQVNNQVLFEISFILDSLEIVDLVMGVDYYEKTIGFINHETSYHFEKKEEKAKLEIRLTNTNFLYETSNFEKNTELERYANIIEKIIEVIK